ncbi:hypothetical protein NKI63_12715 [Mesorhizobium sp. M0410]|uniref:hypothetical protein n=1 Tax=Mesorhizobium sp. M0410 TaxID=2956943 RepID=UPI003339AF9B
MANYEEEVNFVSSQSPKERQRTFKKKMYDAGYVQVTVWVHASQAADIKTLADRLKADRDLTVGPIRNEATGRLQKLRR